MEDEYRDLDGAEPDPDPGEGPGSPEDARSEEAPDREDARSEGSSDREDPLTEEAPEREDADEPRPRRSGNGRAGSRRSRARAGAGARANGRRPEGSRGRRSSRGRDLRTRPERKRRGGRVVAGCIAILLVLGLIAAGAAYAVWDTLYKPAVEVAPGKPVTVTIAKGMGSEGIARALASKGVVTNANMFRWTARDMGADSQLKTGTYSFTTGMDYEAAIAKLVKGPDIVFFDVPIPEEFTVEQVAERFEARAGIPAGEFLALARTGAPRFAAERPYLKDAYGGSLQGYLFPKTYRVRKGMSAEKVIGMMLDQFEREMAGVDLTYAKKKGFGLRQVLTVASIIDREARIPGEFPKVAAVIYNRVRIGMALQMCSTVMYGLDPKPDRLTNEHLKHEHPFNTYLHAGLPPGPMGSPGLAAIQAAAHPASQPYLYFVLTGKDGSQTFCSSYEQFLKAKAVNKRVFP